MNRNTQELKTDLTRPLVIETPEGLIEILHAAAGRSRGIVITTPGHMRCHRGRDRAMKNARFLREDTSGRILPKFHLLTPNVDEEGEIAFVSEPKALKVAGKD